MKARLLVLLPCMLALTGCIRYGQGQTIGYVYAVDDGILWDKVWYRTSLESSQSDCYLVGNDTLKQQLRELAGKKKVKLSYARHLFTLASCGGGEHDPNKTNDEITAVEVVE